MKKNRMKAALVAVVGLVAGINVFNAQKAEVLSDIALANVEALALTESEGDYYCPYEGYGCIVRYTNGTSITFWGKWSVENP